MALLEVEGYYFTALPCLVACMVMLFCALFFDENEAYYAVGCSVIYHLLLMSSAAIFTSSEVHLRARLQPTNQPALLPKKLILLLC